MAQPQATGSRQLDPVAARLSEDWIQQHGAAYVGNWVALRGDELLGASRSFLELKSRLAADGTDGEDVLFAVVD
jgi:hypothetical protein